MYKIMTNPRLPLPASLLLLIFVSCNILAQKPRDGILSLPFAMSDEKFINASYPAISDWYQFCKEAEDAKNKTDWGLCTGYLYAAVQQIYQNTKKQCPNFSVKEVMGLVDAETLIYEERHSSLTKGKDGKVIEGARTYQPGKLTAWQRPAFPLLMSVLSVKCAL